MTVLPGGVVEAAGGVLWRPAERGVEVAVVHRPTYDDWSLPKGKLRTGEHPVVGACREVLEETGFAAVPGRPLHELRYRKDGRPKRVRYWSMRASDGAFVPGDEVDEMVWADVAAALALLSPERDRSVLEAFLAGPSDTWPVLLVRHASAGDRHAWPGEDSRRPLDERGHAQARALAGVLAVYNPDVIYSADVLRCLDTVAPLATRTGLAVRPEPLLSEGLYTTRPDAALRWLAELASRRAATVACSQRGPVPELVERLTPLLRGPSLRLPKTPKGGYVVVHLYDDDHGVRIVQAEAFDPPC